PVVVEEVEEVAVVEEQPAAEGGDQDLEMFDQAFDQLGGQPAAAAEEEKAFSGLRLAPAPEEVAAAPAEEAAPQPTELTAPEDSEVLHGLMNEQEAAAEA